LSEVLVAIKQDRLTTEARITPSGNLFRFLHDPMLSLHKSRVRHALRSMIMEKPKHLFDALRGLAAIRFARARSRHSNASIAERSRATPRTVH
jgi:hypothetical protein